MTQRHEWLAGLGTWNIADLAQQSFVGGSMVTADGSPRNLRDASLGTDWMPAVDASVAQVDAAIDAASTCFDSRVLVESGGAARRDMLWALAAEIARRADAIAAVDAATTGIAVRDTRADVTGCVAALKYFASLADTFEGRVVPTRQSWLSFVEYEPAGVVAAIVPWNAPALMYGWKIGAALAAGCPIVLKPSEFSPLGALLVADAAAAAGLPAGAVNVVSGGAEVGSRLVEHPEVRRVLFTGGDVAGAAIAKATAARFVRPVLELGGNAPLVIFDDADIESAAKAAATVGFRRGGQVCNAAGRLIVSSSIYDEFSARVAGYVAQIRVGDALDASTHVGPVVSETRGEQLLAAIVAEAESGRRVVAGGKRMNLEAKDGFYLAPTVTEVADAQDPLWRNERFGPVICMMPFDDDEEALSLANSVDYGLTAGVFTSSHARALRAVRQIRAGSVWVNVYPATHHALPHGGIKRSGAGRELGVESVWELVEPKSVVMAMNPHDTPNPFEFGE